MLTSLQNPLVKQLRKLHQAKYRRQQQSFLLEGTNLLEAALQVDWPLEVVCYTQSWQTKYPALFAQIALVPRVEEVSPEVLQSVATTVNPDGVVAIARSQAQAVPAIQQLGLVLESIQDPGNVGTMLRTAVATGCEGLLLSEGCVDLENPKVLRASAGAWFRLRSQVCASLSETLADYQSQGFQVVATTPRDAVDYWAVDYRQPTLVVVGNEGAGLSTDVLRQADHRVKIPLQSGVESLNAAIATAVILYEVQRQRTGS